MKITILVIALIAAICMCMMPVAAFTPMTNSGSNVYQYSEVNMVGGSHNTQIAMNINTGSTGEVNQIISSTMIGVTHTKLVIINFNKQPTLKFKFIKPK